MKMLAAEFIQFLVHYFHIVSVFAAKQYSGRVIRSKILNIIVLLYFFFQKIDASFDIVSYNYFGCQRKCFVVEGGVVYHNCLYLFGFQRRRNPKQFRIFRIGYDTAELAGHDSPC